MASKVWLSTQQRAVDPEEATVSAYDRGFMYGDSVYETMRTAGGAPVDLTAHLERLRQSAAGIGLDVGFSDTQIRTAIGDGLAAAMNPESRVRLVVTRGQGRMLLDTRGAGEALMVVYVDPLVLPTAEQYERGLSVHIVDVTKGLLDPKLKTGNYLPSILALREAIEAGADDAIMCNADGEVAEGATSNLFIVSPDGVLKTPSLSTGLLEGLTRRRVLEVARDEGIPTREQKLVPSDLREAREAFLTSSVRGLMPVTRVDATTLGNGRIGALTARLRATYEGRLEAWAKPSQ